MIDLKEAAERLTRMEKGESVRDVYEGQLINGRRPMGPTLGDDAYLNDAFRVYREWLIEHGHLERTDG